MSFQNLFQQPRPFKPVAAFLKLLFGSSLFENILKDRLQYLPLLEDGLYNHMGPLV